MNRFFRHILLFPALALLLPVEGCRKEETPAAEVHPYTEEELAKKRLDDVFTLVVEEIGDLSVANITSFWVRRVHLSEVDGKKHLKLDLPDGMVVQGNLDALEVFDQGEPLCAVELTGEGLVFRFDDGTTYSVLSVLLVEPLMDLIAGAYGAGTSS